MLHIYIYIYIYIYDISRLRVNINTLCNNVNKPAVILMTHTTVFVTVSEFHVINWMKLTVYNKGGAEFHTAKGSIWASAGPDKNEIQCKK